MLDAIYSVTDRLRDIPGKAKAGIAVGLVAATAPFTVHAALSTFDSSPNKAPDPAVTTTVPEKAPPVHTAPKETAKPKPKVAPTPKPTAPECAVKNPDWLRYAAIEHQYGAPNACPVGRTSVLGLRAGEGDVAGAYRDTFVVLSPTGQVTGFQGSTVPSMMRSSASPDVNHDGAGDVATLRTGAYEAVPNGPHDGLPSYHVLTPAGSGYVPAWRDTNHNGVLEPLEKIASEQRGDTATAVLFHVGTWSGPSSIACQNLTRQDVGAFINAVGGPNATFDYFLANS